MFGNGGLSLVSGCGSLTEVMVMLSLITSSSLFISLKLFHPSRPLREIIFGFFLPLRARSTQRPLATQPFFLRGLYIDFSELGDLCAFAGDTSPEFFSRQHAKGVQSSHAVRWLGEFLHHLVD